MTHTRSLVLGVLALGMTQIDFEPAQRKVVTRATLGTATSVLLPMPPGGNGDFNYGFGLHIYKASDGSWRALTTSWNPQAILEYKLPTTLTGTATFVKNYGTFELGGWQFGVYYDEATKRICGSYGNTYDTDPGTNTTLTCAEIDPATGKMKTALGSDGKPHVVKRLWIFSEAKQPCLALPVPTGTDVGNNSVTFGAPTGLTTKRLITVAQSGGGLLQSSYYYVRAVNATTITFHRTYYDAEQNKSAIDLTAPITSAMTSCTARGDRRTMGGMTPIPPEFVAPFHGNVFVGFGGYQSIVTSGNQSMGPTACAAQLPAQDYYGTVPCTPVVGYRYVNSAGGCATFSNRDARYTDVVDWEDCPEKGADALAKFGHGKFATGDTIGQAGYFIATPAFIGFGAIVDQMQGCQWYGDNTANRYPLVHDSGALVPLSTNTATSTLTMPDTIKWADGTMVAPSANQGGLSTLTAYFTRKPAGISGNVYRLLRTLAEAQGKAGPTPSSTNTVQNRVVFALPHGLTTRAAVHIDATGGGLTAGTTYYVNAAYPTQLTFHRTVDETAGSNLGQSDAKAIDLTGPISTAVIANSELKISAPLTAGLRLVSYCANAGGTKASLNSQGSRHVMVSYNPADLQAVYAGQRVENQQPVNYADLPMPGITYGTYGVPGMPGMGRRVMGVMWVTGLDRLAIQIQDTTSTKQGRRVHFFPLQVAP
jgi:hypothetical protein